MTRSEKLFTLFAMMAILAIGAEYAITRPASNALFLTVFSAQGYPWVWLATVPLNLWVIYLYNRFLPKVGPLRMLWTLSAAVIAINALTAFLYPYFPKFIFFQYAWKDIYILLMFKQLWSMIHCTIPAARAKWLYSCIYGMGAVGAILGSLIPGFLAPVFGSEKILFFTLPVYLGLIFSYTMAFHRSGTSLDIANPHPKEALSLIRNSPLLIGILWLVIFMQVSVGLMEYQFNAHLELNILEKDLRTAYCGQLAGIGNLLNLVFQALGGVVMIRFFSLRRNHLLIPILLCGSALCSVLFPSFAVITCSYVFLKALDFSLFGVVREMLYIPLSSDAKFRAKAVIDVFAYRTSKAGVSLGLLLLQVLVGSALLPLASYLSIAIFIAWLATVSFLFRSSREQLLSRNII